MNLRATSTSRFAGAFTLIEVLMVLAVLVVLAAAALPSLTAQLDDRARLQEEEQLRTLGAAFESYVMRTRSIPSAATFATSLASEVGLPSNKVLVNVRQQSRIVLVDNRLRVGTNGSAVLPFAQTVFGSIQPVNPRIAIVSSLGVALPASLTNGVLSDTEFDAVWGTAPDKVPSTWTTWKGKGPDLKIQRLYFGDLFMQLAMNAQGVPYGSYSVDNTSTNVMSGDPRSLWVIKGTRLALNAPDATVQVVVVVKNSLSFVCDSGAWRSGGGAQAGWTSDSLVGTDLGQAAASFLASPTNSTATVTQTDFVNALTTYLSAYTAYANSNFSNQSLSNSAVYARLVLQTNMNYLIQ